MKIQEDSKVIIKDCSGYKRLGIFIPSTDVEIVENSIILVDGGLYCIERIRQIAEGYYEFDVYWQDAVLAKDGKLFESASDE